MVCVSGVSGWELGKGGGVVTHARFLKEGNGDEDKPLSAVSILFVQGRRTTNIWPEWGHRVRQRF